MQKILVIQTAFIGDAILMTPILEAIHNHYPDAQIDILVRQESNDLFINHPYLANIYILNKKNKKLLQLFFLIIKFRREQYDIVINTHRFLSTGLITILSKAKKKIGFIKNPLSYFYTQRHPHIIGEGDCPHEIERNLLLLSGIVPIQNATVKLYPSFFDYEKVKNYINTPYVCIAPASQWYTKQMPAYKWIDFINNIPKTFNIYLLGSKKESDLCDIMIAKSTNKNTINLAGRLNLLESAALMEQAAMNYVNDSAPLHLASATNAVVTAIFCSTTPHYGFGPVSSINYIVESTETLPCKPCGLHGKKTCPLQHFNCANTIKTEQLIATLPQI